MSKFEHKAVSAKSRGIIVSFLDVNKHKFVRYSEYVEHVQITGTPKHPRVQEPVFNKIQQQLYSEAVYGLNVYSYTQIQEMPEQRKKEIIKRYTITQRILNKWKQGIVQKAVDDFFVALFPKSPILKEFAKIDSYDPKYLDRHTFRELGISQKDVADKLIEKRMLPNNFYQLA